MKTTLAFGGLLGLLIAAGPAAAQNTASQTSPPTQNQDSDPQKTQTINNQDTRSGNDQWTRNQGMHGTGTTTFEQLDTSHAGYLTSKDTGHDAWLRKHFAQCDSDRDGKLTREEYDACTRNRK